MSFCNCGKEIKYANESRCEDCYALGLRSQCIDSERVPHSEMKKVGKFEAREHGGAYRQRGIRRRK